ncbi:MAG: hypothetical protein P4L84_30220 [Isosphaeraceae bacterium]|nr:hypothetical protein [Isosphaeraceae bacterium]
MRVFSRSSAAALSSAAVVLMGALSLVAQEAAAPKPAENAPKAKRSGDASRRVPDYFGDIGLSAEQKESIYKIREKHQSKIADLLKQVAAARKDELAECETVLSDTQKQFLEQRRRAAAEKKAAAKKKSAEEKASSEKKEETKTDAAK